MDAMSGLTVRWSLADAEPGIDKRLAEYVESTSHAAFDGREGLAFKTWRMSPGAWFEGSYVFVDDAARDAFQRAFTAGAAESPASAVIGAAPVLIEACTVLATVAGSGGFSSRASYDAV